MLIDRMEVLVLLILLNIVLINTSAGSPSFKVGKSECDGLCTVSEIIDVYKKGRTTVIVYEKPYEYPATTLGTVATGNDYVLLCKYWDFKEFFAAHMQRVIKQASLSEIRAQLNLMVLCRVNSVQHLLNMAAEMDNTTGQGFTLRHFSTWLIISPDPPSNVNTTLDNVALIQVDQLDTPNILQETEELFTLLLKPGRREWSRVWPCDLSDDEVFSSLFPNTRRGLNGRRLILSTLEWTPLVQSQEKLGEVRYVGAGIDTIDILKEKFNFSYDVVEPPDGQWGDELENGSWTGVIEMLQKQEADMCPVWYAITERRKKVLDFSTLIDNTWYSALYTRKSDKSSSWLFLLSGFSWSVYVGGSAALLWSWLVLIFIRIQKLKLGVVLRSLEVIIYTPLRQAILKMSNNSSERVLVFTWCAFCMAMTTIYGGNLVAFATVDRYQAPFHTLQQLAEQNEYGVGIYHGTYGTEMIKSSNLTSLYNKILETNKGIFPSDEELMQQLKERKIVLLVPREAWDFIRSTTCHVLTMKESFFPTHSGLIFKKYSPLKKLFDNQLAVLKENGVYDRLVSRWKPKPKKCDIFDNGPRLKLTHLKATIVVCAVGILTASVMLLVEMCKKRANI